MANDNHLQMVKEYYEKIGVEEMSIVEVIHMAGFAEWLERRRTLRAVDETICTCKKGFEHPHRPGVCGVCGNPFHR